MFSRKYNISPKYILAWLCYEKKRAVRKKKGFKAGSYLRVDLLIKEPRENEQQKLTINITFYSV